MSYLTFELTYQQATIAVDCLHKAFKKYQDQPSEVALTDQLLPYLIHATVLIFINRDQRAFQSLYKSNVYQKLSLRDRLRQLPTLTQLQAILNSQKSNPAWQTLNKDELKAIQDLTQWTDQALGIDALKMFRDQLLINGVPPKAFSTIEPFSVSSFDYVELTMTALAAWQKLHTLDFG